MGQGWEELSGEGGRRAKPQSAQKPSNLGGPPAPARAARAHHVAEPEDLPQLAHHRVLAVPRHVGDLCRSVVSLGSWSRVHGGMLG